MFHLSKSSMQPLLIAVAFGFTAPLLATTLKVDPKQSKVAWVGKKIAGQHDGTLVLKNGELDLEGETLKGGKFTVDMASIKVLDLKDPKYNADLTNHLKSDDFFSVDKFPEATFEVKKVKKQKDGTFAATGPMTIKGISHDVTIPLKVEKKGQATVVSGKAKLDRTKWNVRYRSGKFFPEIGDKLIYDDFEIEVTLSAKKA